MIRIPYISPLFTALEGLVVQKLDSFALALNSDRWTMELEALTGMTEDQAYGWLRYIQDLQAISPSDTTESLWIIFRRAVAESGSAAVAAAVVRDGMRRRGLTIPTRLEAHYGC